MSSFVNATSGRIRIMSSVLFLVSTVFLKRPPITGIRLRMGIPVLFFLLLSVISPPKTIVEPFEADTVVLIYRVAIFGIKLPSIFVESATLSSFCRISSVTSFSELISGTTSSWRATFLNWILDCVPKFVAGVAPCWGMNDDNVLTGTGISVPEAIMAFLLLLVKTIGREITLNLPVESSAWTIEERPKPVLRKRLAPPLLAAPATRLAKLVRVVGSRGVIPMLFFVSAAPPVSFGRVVWLPSGLVTTCVPVLLKV